MSTGLVLAATIASAIALSACSIGGSTSAGSPHTSGSSPSGAPGTETSSATPGSTQVAPGDTIDGFKVGVRVTCGGGIGPAPSGGRCPGLDQRKAIAALDARDPGHAAIVSLMTFTDGTQPEPMDVTGNAPTPNPAPTAHPGPLVTVFVFVLADGSIQATGVACPASIKHNAIVAGEGPCVGVGSYP